MSTDFVGRRKELAAQKQAGRAEGGAFIPVYSRRHVGKSELLVKFLSGKPAIYLTGKVAPAELQIREFLRAAALALREPLLADHPAPEFHPQWSRPNQAAAYFIFPKRRALATALCTTVSARWSNSVTCNAACR